MSQEQDKVKEHVEEIKKEEEPTLKDQTDYLTSNKAWEDLDLSPELIENLYS